MMNRRDFLALAFCFVLGMAALVQGRTHVGGAQGAAPVAMPAAELKWVDLDPAGAPGVKVADLWGNRQTGAFGAFALDPTMLSSA